MIVQFFINALQEEKEAPMNNILKATSMLFVAAEVLVSILVNIVAGAMLTSDHNYPHTFFLL
jgi:hypothetical protein